ncbi:MAG: preprotein translocase subunit SecG [Ardenticatenaceae bacterium]
MATALYLSLIIVSAVIIVLVLLQGKGSLGGGIFGGDAMYSSRRGAEKTLYNMTIGFSVVFLLVDLIAFLYAN